MKTKKTKTADVPREGKTSAVDRCSSKKSETEMLKDDLKKSKLEIVIDGSPPEESKKIDPALFPVWVVGEYCW